MPLTSLTSATAQWLLTAYPAQGGVLGATLAEAQTRQAVTVASWLRYPTQVDAELVNFIGPGGSARLDHLAPPTTGDEAWRTWVDEIVASWAACLLTDPVLAREAVRAANLTEHGSALRRDFGRLVGPDHHDRAAATLLRHRDLIEPVAQLHRPELVQRIGVPRPRPASHS